MLTIYLMLLDDENDRELFRTFYEHSERRLYRVALSILRSEALAEEALHEAMISILLHFETFKKFYYKSRKENESWCVTIVKRTALTILRKETRSGPLDENWDAPVSEGIEEEDSYRRLVELIRGMPDTYRAVLELKFVAEHSNNQIAKALGVSESVVATRIFRGRALLIERLKKEGYQYECI